MPTEMKQRSRQASPRLVTLVREPVPSAGELAAVRKRFRGLFAERLNRAKTDNQKRALADELLQAAVGMPGDPVGAHALQTAAVRVAIDGGGVEQLLRAIDQRVGRFEVDAYEENMSWMLAFGKGVTDKDADTMNGIEYAKRAIKVILAAVQEDDYVDALAVSRYTFRLVDQQREEAIPTHLSQLRGRLGAAKREFEQVGDSLADFRIDPNDGDAAAAIGRYLCFIKGDWQRGLELLTRGGPEELQAVADRDMRGADDYRNEIAIGDAWWDLSEKARTGVYRQSARDRAEFWYERAFVVMPESLDRMHVKSRLDEAKEAPPSSPLAVIAELAKELGVDLKIGLAAVADVGQSAGRNSLRAHE